ncbi:MAG: flagellar export chaperone FliS [Halothiobacillaceae bacterium]|jgi:flagellar protein FliS
MYISPRSMGASFYSNVGLQSSIHNASPHRLIQMLMDGFIERVNVARIAMERGDNALRGAQISKAIAILGGLKDGLDFEKGGELASNLSELYSYMELALFEASAKNDPERLEEVKRLMLEIKGAWDAIPEITSAP